MYWVLVRVHPEMYWVLFQPVLDLNSNVIIIYTIFNRTNNIFLCFTK